MISAQTELTLAEIPADIGRAAPWLAKAGSDLGIPPCQFARLDRCFDEVLANILTHGGPGARQAPVVAQLKVVWNGSDGEATLEVSDGGTAFDPLKITGTPKLRTLADADLGGLGLMLLRANSDALSYHRDEGRNRLVITVRWREPGP
jgi:anti-sigma regulatory factor (Ser/Thr protein kinase)